MNTIELKIAIIDTICKIHPSAGVDKGWSTYTGGMKDSGNWFFRKMLDVPMEELSDFMSDLKREAAKPKIPLTPEQEKDSKTFMSYKSGHHVSVLEQKTMETFRKDAEFRMLFDTSDPEPYPEKDDRENVKKSPKHIAQHPRTVAESFPPDFPQKRNKTLLIESPNDAVPSKAFLLPFYNIRQLAVKYKGIIEAFEKDDEVISDLLIEHNIPHMRFPYGFSFDIDKLSDEQLEIVKNIERPFVDLIYKECGVISYDAGLKECVHCDEKWTTAEHPPIITETHNCPECLQFVSSKQINK